MLKRILIVLAVAGALALTGLVTYSYLFLNKSRESALRGETAVLTSALIIRTSQGAFIDKDAPVNEEITAPYPGYRAPDFALADMSGNLVRLSELRGRPVLLNFWASWCPPCRKEMPDLQQFHRQYGEVIRLIGIDWGEDKRDVEAFLQRFGITYPNLMDQDGKVFVLYQLTGLPTSFWIDEQGIIRGLWLGAMKTEDMVAGFQKTTRALGGAGR